MPRSFWLQMALYIFCMLLGAFGLRYALMERFRMSQFFFRMLLTASVLCFCLGFIMVLLVGKSYPEYYGSSPWWVSGDYNVAIHRAWHFLNRR